MRFAYPTVRGTVGFLLLWCAAFASGLEVAAQIRFSRSYAGRPVSYRYLLFAASRFCLPPQVSHQFLGYAFCRLALGWAIIHALLAVADESNLFIRLILSLSSWPLWATSLC